MPESTVKTLSESGIMTIMTVRHLLPIVQRKQVLVAGGRRKEAYLVGCRGEVPLAHRDPKKPLLATVPAGKIILGHEVARELGVTTSARGSSWPRPRSCWAWRAGSRASWR